MEERGLGLGQVCDAQGVGVLIVSPSVVFVLKIPPAASCPLEVAVCAFRLEARISLQISRGTWGKKNHHGILKIFLNILE